MLYALTYVKLSHQSAFFRDPAGTGLSSMVTQICPDTAKFHPYELVHVRSTPM
jgi:hypothetical protein